MAYSFSPVDTKRAAFARGFWKGMAAPLVLFSNFNLPPEAAPVEYRPLQRRVPESASDWVRVGDELRRAAAEDRRQRG